MNRSTQLCEECRRADPPRQAKQEAEDGLCASCGSPLDGKALSEFADRLARFGLGATRKPLLGRTAELPDAK
jgi:hypothetical protein